MGGRPPWTKDKDKNKDKDAKAGEWQPRNTSKKTDERPAKSGSGKPGGKPGEKPSGKPGAKPGERTGPRPDTRLAGRDKSGPRRSGPRPRLAPVLPIAAGNELIYGRNAVLEALRGQRKLHRIWIAEGIREDDRTTNLLALAAERRVPVDRVPRELLDDSTRGANHQGVGMETGPFQYIEVSEVISNTGTVLVLDHLQDPQNFGTLLRAAEAAGVAGVIIPEDR
ncbi:MAG: TrmH family RNA methyltransferase, partial [Thermomicrobiales bacterium]